MPYMSCLSFCCCLTASTCVCLLTFFALHSANADDGAARPWSTVFAPLSALAGVVLLALCAAPLTLPPSAQPTARVWGTWGLGALATLLFTATADGGTWALALAPLGGMLLVRACTLPPEPLAAHGAPEALGLGCWRLLARLELPLGGLSLLLLHGQLAAPESLGSGWWAVALPLLALEAMSLAAGLRALSSTTAISSPPPARVVSTRTHARGPLTLHIRSLSPLSHASCPPRAYLSLSTVRGSCRMGP